LYQTLANIATEKNSTFPFPEEVLPRRKKTKKKKKKEKEKKKIIQNHNP
jgi:hypothetical protein